MYTCVKKRCMKLDTEQSGSATKSATRFDTNITGTFKHESKCYVIYTYVMALSTCTTIFWWKRPNLRSQTTFHASYFIFSADIKIKNKRGGVKSVWLGETLRPAAASQVFPGDYPVIIVQVILSSYCLYRVAYRLV